MPRFGAFAILSVAGLLGSALLLPWAWLVEGPPRVTLRNVHWPGVLYLTVFATALAYALYFRGLHKTGAARGALVFFLKPILASGLAWFWLGERLTLHLIVGAIFVLTGLVLALAPGGYRSRRISWGSS